MCIGQRPKCLRELEYSPVVKLGNAKDEDTYGNEDLEDLLWNQPEVERCKSFIRAI